jgi:hypothetical protein
MIMTYDITRRSAAALLLGPMLPLRAGRADEPTVVRMSYDIPLFILPFFVAIDRKMFEANGITSVKVPGNSGMTNLMAVSGGATDIGSSGVISIAIAALTEVPVRIIASFNEVENMELACIKSIKTPGDLVGKRIAVAQGTPSHYYISLLAKKYGLQPTQINLVRLGPAEMISALTAGSIDGFVWQELFLSKARGHGPEQVPPVGGAGPGHDERRPDRKRCDDQAEAPGRAEVLASARPGLSVHRGQSGRSHPDRCRLFEDGSRRCRRCDQADEHRSDVEGIRAIQEIGGSGPMGDRGGRRRAGFGGSGLLCLFGWRTAWRDPSILKRVPRAAKPERYMQ